MSKKDYEVIATAIRKTRLSTTDYDDFSITSDLIGDAFDLLVEELSAAFKESNDRFDADRFKTACSREG